MPKKIPNTLQSPCYEPSVLKPSKRNLSIHRMEGYSFTQLYPREVFLRFWQTTYVALRVDECPARKILADKLVEAGIFWLKTGLVRNKQIPAGTHTYQQPYQQNSYEVVRLPPHFARPKKGLMFYSALFILSARMCLITMICAPIRGQREQAAQMNNPPQREPELVLLHSPVSPPLFFLQSLQSIGSPVSLQPIQVPEQMGAIQAASEDFPVRPQILLDSLELDNGNEILSLGALSMELPDFQLEFQQAAMDWNVADPHTNDTVCNGNNGLIEDWPDYSEPHSPVIIFN